MENITTPLVNKYIEIGILSLRCQVRYVIVIDKKTKGWRVRRGADLAQICFITFTYRLIHISNNGKYFFLFHKIFIVLIILTFMCALPSAQLISINITRPVSTTLSYVIEEIIKYVERTKGYFVYYSLRFFFTVLIFHDIFYKGLLVRMQQRIKYATTYRSWFFTIYARARLSKTKTLSGGYQINYVASAQESYLAAARNIRQLPNNKWRPPDNFFSTCTNGLPQFTVLNLHQKVNNVVHAFCFLITYF